MRKRDELVNVSLDSVGSLVLITPEEKLWMERIERYPLWYRYAPKYIQQSSQVRASYIGDWERRILEKELSHFVGEHGDLRDKRTRNEIGQEKHESRKCSDLSIV